MKLVVCKDVVDLAREASTWCETNIQRTGARSIYIPAGSTPTPLYAIWEKSKPEYLTGVELVQVDEILDGDRALYFRQFLRQQLPSFSSQLVMVEAEREIAPLAILGLGLNGHVAFHEPGTDPKLRKGIVTLSEITKRELGVHGPTNGLTYGLGTFWECDAILVLVSGDKKQEILRRWLNEDEHLPATHLLRHPRLTIIVDESARPKTF